MKNKWMLIIGMVVLTLPFLACSESAPPAQTTWMSEVEAMWKATPEWNSYGPRLTALESRSNASVDTSSLNNKDNDLQNQITAMKTDFQTKLDALTVTVNNLPKTSSSSGGISNGGTTGNIPGFTPGTPQGTIPVSATGGVVSQVNWVQGTTQVYTSPQGGSQNIWYVQRLINESTTIQYVRPMITLGISNQYGNNGNQSYIAGMNINISSPQGNVQGIYTPPAWWTSSPPASPTGITGLPISSISATSPSITQAANTFGAPTGTMTLSMAPGLGQMSNSIMIMPIAGLGNNLGEFYISPGSYTDVTVMLQNLSTSTAVMWNISASYSSHI